MRANLLRSVKLTGKWEGLYSNDPDDPGGATYKGVTTAVYNAYRDRNGLARRDVRKLTEQEHAEIIAAGYWNPLQCDRLPTGVDGMAFDAAYNSGAPQSAKWLQRTVGVKADGWVGNDTITAVDKACHNDNGTIAVIRDMADRRLDMLRNLSTFWKFGKGWQNRIGEWVASAVAWTLEDSGVDAAARLEQEAAVADDRASVDRTKAGSAVAVGVPAGGGSGAFGTGDIAATGNATFLIVGIIIAIGCAAIFFAWNRRKKGHTAIADSLRKKADEVRSGTNSRVRAIEKAIIDPTVNGLNRE